MNKFLIKPLVAFILRNHENHDWTIQGLGMLRVYLSDELRLHIWHSHAQVPEASVIHTHPWDFCSNVIAGCVTDVHFKERNVGRPYHKQLIRCGEGGGLEGEPKDVRLGAGKYKVYTEGDKYYMLADQLHYTQFDNGTVTIVKRTFKEDTEHAAVYWPEGGEWGTAEPRKATPEEVKLICEDSLRKYFT